MPAPPPDRGRWYAGAIGASSPHGPSRSTDRTRTSLREYPGQLPDLAVGLGRRDDAGIGHTARPLPIAVADSPIEAASPDPQQPMRFLE